MAIRPEDEFVGKINAADADYPQGSARDITTPSDGTGTPWKARLINDLWGFYQKLLDVAGITPSGSPDTVQSSDYFDALATIIPRQTLNKTTMLNLDSIKAGDIIETSEFEAGSGVGAATYTVIAGAGGVNGYNILPHKTVVFSFVLRVEGSVDTRMVGDTGDGTTNDTAAMQFAIDNYESTEIVGGTHLIDGLVVNDDNREVIFTGDVYLKANDNDVVLFLQTESFARHKGTFRTDSNGKTGVIGMGCMPEDRSQTTTLVQTNHNQMPGIIGDSQLELCIGLQCGPDVGGVDSGCFYNVFPFGRGRGAVGGVRMFDGPNASSSSSNRNAFHDFRMGTGGGVSANFGLWIESGDTNKFFGCDWEGVGSGVARTSPLATPTAIKIEATDANGIDNNFNTFFGGQCEANTRDLDIDNVRTYIYGMGYDDTKSITPSSSVFTTIPARDSSGARTRVMGLEYTNVAGDSQLDSLKLLTGKLGFPAVAIPTADPNTLDDYNEGTFTSELAFDGTSTGITYSSQSGFYTKTGREVNFRLFVALTSKGTDTGSATITGLPYLSNSSANHFSSVSMRINDITYTGRIQGYISTGTSIIILEEATAAGSRSSILDSDFSNASSIMISGNYMV